MTRITQKGYFVSECLGGWVDESVGGWVGG